MNHRTSTSRPMPHPRRSPYNGRILSFLLPFPLSRPAWVLLVATALPGVHRPLNRQRHPPPTPHARRGRPHAGVTAPSPPTPYRPHPTPSPPPTTFFLYVGSLQCWPPQCASAANSSVTGLANGFRLRSTADPRFLSLPHHDAHPGRKPVLPPPS